MSVSMAKPYRPKLSDLMHLCEGNYVLLMKILADCEQVGQQRTFAINETTHCQIDVIEVTRYTSVVDVSQLPCGGCEQLNKIIYPKMRVRLYHDARMVDIISCQGVQQIKPRYDYPNDAMHQPDEKQQVNQFLKDWLSLCLQLGYVKTQVSLSR